LVVSFYVLLKSQSTTLPQVEPTKGVDRSLISATPDSSVDERDGSDGAASRPKDGETSVRPPSSGRRDSKTGAIRRSQERKKGTIGRDFSKRQARSKTEGVPQESSTKVSENQPRGTVPAREGDESPSRLTILAQPLGRVYIDGRLVSSSTPVRGRVVSSGSHEVRVVFSSTRETSERFINVKQGQHRIVRFFGGE
jgi:hypothetical protein